MTFPIIHQSIVESTQDVAQSLLKEGMQAPFAVLADEQRSGRGRQGRVWQSVKGNLFLTLVLNPSQNIEFGFTPIIAGALFCSAIANKFGIRPTLKWPNDILFAGRKLAGILCETTRQGDKQGPVFIGLGLNINFAPEILDATNPYAMTTCLLNVLQTVDMLDVHDLASAVVAEFKEKWPTITHETAKDLIDQFLIEPGQLFVRDSFAGKKEFLVFNELKSTGEAVFYNENLKSDESLSAVDEKLFWIGQMPEKADLFIADIGNSRIKLGLIGKHTTEVMSFLPDSKSDMFEFAQGSPQKSLNISAAPMYYASVNHKNKEILLNNLPGAIKSVAVPKRRVLSFGEKYEIKELGIDRLAAIEAGISWRQSLKDKILGSMIVVSCGTAVTIDVVSFEREHMGGAILPGFALAARSLKDGTANLPLVEIDQQVLAKDSVIGRNTKSAIAHGIFEPVLAYIEKLVRVHHVTHPEGQIVVTGGDGEVIAKKLGAHFDANLVLKGLRIMLMGGN